MIEFRRISSLVFIAVCLLSFATESAATAVDLKREPKRILLLYYSFGANSVNAKSVRAELERGTDQLLEIYEAPFARAADEAAMDRYAEYLSALFPDNILDLVIAVGAPAVVLFQRNRQRLFPSAKMLAIAEVRRIPALSFKSDDVVFATRIDLAGVLKNVMQVLPETTNIEVVVGNSPSERDWFEQIRVAFEPFQDRASIKGTSDLTFDSMLKRVAALPPHSAIVFLLLLTDAAGQTHEDTKVLTQLYQTANAPIFSYYDSGFGSGLVGGPMIPVQKRSRMMADAAVRMLRGESVGELTPIGAAAPRFDWRELQRWGIDESRLPDGSEVYFHPPTIWEQYRLQILTISAVFLAQTGLISWLIYEHRRRHHAEILARNTISELAHMNRIATAGQLSGSIAHEVSQPLTAMISQANAALRWLAANTPNIDEARDALIQIVSTGHRAGDVVQNIRAMFSKDMGEMKTVDINGLITTVLDILKVDLVRHEIELQTDLNSSIPVFNGNAVQLQQVILNLVINAGDAMASAPRRTLRVISGPRKPNFLHVSVEDTGRGVAASDLERIFEPLFSTKELGMGMGLSICRSIIEKHGGHIWASASSLGGSAFHFDLPLNSRNA
jgi:signal transduction histidine kinase